MLILLSQPGGALCPSEIPFGKITSTCTRVLNERCIYTCYHGHQYPDHERSLRWATCSQDPDTLEYVWNVPATAVCKGMYKNMTAVDPSLARVTCETSQVLLAGGQDFLGDLLFPPHLTIESTQNE